jgi:hypothetical protein
MGRHVVTQTVPCPRCGTFGQKVFVAESRPSGLRSAESFHCASCTLAEESDGSELSPDARQAFLGAKGRWILRLLDLGPRRREALRVLGSALHVSPSKLLGLRAGTPIADGTLVEVEQLEDLLAAAGATVERKKESH